MNFLLSDMVSRIRIGYIARTSSVKVLKSSLINSILEVLLQEGYILGFFDHGFFFVIYLKYINGAPLFKHVEVFCTPTKKLFLSVKDVDQKFSFSFVLVSTNVGILTNLDVIRLNVGGLLLMRITC